MKNKRSFEVLQRADGSVYAREVVFCPVECAVHSMDLLITSKVSQAREITPEFLDSLEFDAWDRAEAALVMARGEA